MRVHAPSAHLRSVNEEGRKELQLGADLVGAELGPLRAGVGPVVRVGVRDENEIGFTAETQFAEAHVGPVGAKLGLGISTGFHNGENSTGVQVLGTGVDIGKNSMGISVFGSRAECSIM